MAPVSLKISFRYGSHLPVILQALHLTSGDVLELGVGFFSTPVLHWTCALQKRYLLSLENNRRWHRWFSAVYATERHRIDFVPSWDKAAIERPWNIAVVDHSPDFRRKIEIARLANLAKYIIVHDSDGRYSRNYHLEEIYPLFKYRFVHSPDPGTTVLSNFVNVNNYFTATV